MASKKSAISEFSSDDLDRIENLSARLDFFVKFNCKRSARILSDGIKYSLCGLVCDVINYCV